MISDFHFLSPEWFLALLPLAAILWGIRRRADGAGAWQRVVDPGLLPHLLVPGDGAGRWLPLGLLAFGWLAGVLALANPTFERLPVPAYRGELSRVVVLDLSQSMETPDLEPSRLARARYKVADILERSRDGQVGLVAYAGDAFVVSPLTDDADTILAMLDAVTPEIMPVQGSRPDLAIAKASELLARVGASRGEVVLLGDDAGGGADAIAQAQDLSAAGHSLSVIGVGTEAGAPIPGVLGADGRPVVSRLDPRSLQSLARAGEGAYALLSADGTDLDRTLRMPLGLTDQVAEDDAMETEVWRELGPGVLLALLPFAALAFRRGWLMMIALLIGGGLVQPEPAMALSWDDLWQRRDQQAAAALARGEHERVLDLADQPRQRGTASYRLGDFETAAEAFSDIDQADDHYNLGNALARSGRLEEAVAAYDRALAEQPDMEDAAYNKALIEEVLDQQQEQKEQQEQQEPEQAQEQQSGDGGEQTQQGHQSQESEADQQDPEGQSRGDSQSDQPSGDQSQQGQQGQQSGDSDAANASTEQQDEPGQGQEPDAEGQALEHGEEPESAGEPDQGDEADAKPPEQTTGSRADAKSTDETDPADTVDAQETERAAADYRDEAARHLDGQPREESVPPPDEPDQLSTEEREARQAADQWLRRIPDDPAALLRRKFLYQYRSRGVQQGPVTAANPW